MRIEPVRQGGPKRGLVTGFKVSWGVKDVPALQEAFKELQRSKVGRLPRLRGKVQTVARVTDELQAMVDADVAAKLSKMRAEERESGSSAPLSQD